MAAQYDSFAPISVAGGPPTVFGMRGKRISALEEQELLNNPEAVEEQIVLPVEAEYPYGIDQGEYDNEPTHVKDLLPYYATMMRRRQRFQRPPAYIYYFR